MRYSYIYNTLIGDITITTDDDFLISIKFREDIDGIKKETALIKNIKKQIDEYLVGNRTEFDLPIKINGTNFQTKVWNELMKIEYGTCISYQELAERVENKNYSRAVGMANNKNPIPIIIPCHRVIGKNKNLVGYAGGLDKKKKLLEIEKAVNF